MTRTVRRFGRITEAKAARWYGEECLETMKIASAGIKAPVMVAGAPIFMHEGFVLPRAAGGGFASLSDLISEATTGGKSQRLIYSKTEAAAALAAGNSQTMWAATGFPAAGANAAAAPGGTVPTNTTAGSLNQADPIGGDTLHLTTWTGQSTQIGTSMLYDYLFGVNINHATTANAVSGVPTRYTGTDAAGTFVTGRVTTVLGATAHNITLTYTDQAGTTSVAGAATVVRTGSAVNTMPFTQPLWVASLNAASTGIRAITNIALSAASTGNVDWFMGHPLAFLPMPVANVAYVLDGINSAFSLVEVKTGACLSFMAFFKTATAARTDSGMIQLVSG